MRSTTLIFLMLLATLAMSWAGCELEKAVQKVLAKGEPQETR